MPHYVITRSSIDVFGVDVEDMAAAKKAAHEGLGDLVSTNTTINVRPRREDAKVTGTQPASAGGEELTGDKVLANVMPEVKVTQNAPGTKRPKIQNKV